MLQMPQDIACIEPAAGYLSGLLAKGSAVSIHRRAARRDNNERPIIQALESVGAKVEQMSKPCDLAVTFRGQHFLIEVDNPESKYRKREKDQLETFERMKIPMARTADEALRIIGAL